MKTTRNYITLVGLFAAFLALSAAGARAQGLYPTQFAGSFTLPSGAQWGEITLPAGDYNLSYGQLFQGVTTVYVAGKADGSPRGYILARSAGPTSATRNSIVCIRDGNSLLVRKLDLPAINEAVSFAMPHGMKLLAHRQKHGEYTLAQAPMLIQRVPIKMSAK
jgi:hypothetical protein